MSKILKYTLTDYEKDVKDFTKHIQYHQSRVAEYKRYKAVYGIPRGGILLAARLAETTGLEFIDEIPQDHESFFKPANVLVVDDLTDTGRTLEPFVVGGYDTLVIHHKASAICHPTYHARPKEPDVWVEYWWERNEAPAEDSVIRLIEMIGENMKREGLRDTPKRYVKALKFLTGGYETDIESLFTTFDSENYDEVVLLKDIEIYSLCEHHIMPFFGKAHVAYIPSRENRRVVGVSKLARLVDAFARRLQIQERIGDQVTTALVQNLGAVGAACIIEAQHLCMQMRGVQKQNSVMITSSLKGVFLEDSTKGLAARNEVLRLIKD